MSQVMSALESGGIDALRQLPADAFDPEELSQWPLRRVVERDMIAELEFLLERGAAPTSEQLTVLINNAKSPERTGDILVKAASAKKALAFERVQLLVDAGVSIETEGWSALAEAVHRNNEPLATWLLERGANADDPVGYSPYDWKDFRGSMSVSDYARGKKGREWFVALLGAAEEEPPPSLVRDTVGFSATVSLASLIYGRRAMLDLRKRADAERAARLADWIESLDDSPLAVVTEGVVGTTGGALFVGVRIATASAERAALEPTIDPDEAKKTLAPYRKAFWTELDERFGLGLAKERNAFWLVASGPLTTAALVYGGFGPKKKVRALDVPHFEAVDGAGRSHPFMPFGAIDSTDEHRKLSFTKAAMKKRAAKAELAESPRFRLTARYD